MNIQNNWSSPSYLVGGENGTASLKNGLAFSYKGKLTLII